MTCKHREDVLAIVNKDKIQSTRQIVKELEKRKKLKAVNWHMVYAILRDLREEGLIEQMDLDAGKFWKKKK